MASLVLFLATFFPVLREEVAYRFEQDTIPPVLTKTEQAAKGETGAEEVLVPVDEDFGIVIPKIRANAKVVADVDWQDSARYQRALQEGVAHAKGTAKPGESGNIFLFSHSGVDFYEAARYNAVFYLMNKLSAGDEIELFYQGVRYGYRVKEVKIVGAEETGYITGPGRGKTLTLMTCWPAGTTLKRLVVIAEQKEN
ncbi:MAG: hypothetical protein A2808_04035 [Candidatus Moranbacteria bacterium RIFCSPHIGHO2_01_FULL_55_24]|nr:MAG: hypothetical protein A2808_04035 [Candidatus Moranbacteria bacterium RIFCSPHIGHO2_01_FULL_55_24]